VNEAFEAAGRAEQANAQARPIRISDDLVTRPATKATPIVHNFLRFCVIGVWIAFPIRSTSVTASKLCITYRAPAAVTPGTTN